MNKEDQINALEHCLDSAVKLDPDKCHTYGLCAFVDLDEEYSPYVRELIEDLMFQVKLRHRGLDSVWLYRNISNHHKVITGEAMSDSELRIAWENEWRNYIKTLRDSLKAS